MEEKVPIKSLYLHFPLCRHLCNYCDFYKNIKESDEQVSAFETLLLEMDKKHQELLDANNTYFDNLKTLYIGGGTPSLWGVSGAEFIKSYLASKNISFEENYEFTLEVNPGAWTQVSLKAWENSGVNRYSLGVQTLDPRFIKIIDRVHSIEDVHETLEHFSKNSLNFSVDFMLGLPYSKTNKRDIIKELDEIIKYDPNHISLYILTVKNHYIHIDHIPDDEWIEDEYLTVASYLKDKGYIHYEVSNFSKPGFESIHNLEYWKMNTVAALGPSATGYLKNSSTRYKWKVTGPEYQLEVLDDKERKLEEIYMNLRIKNGLDLSLFNDQALRAVAKSWVERGIADLHDEKVILKSKGFLILDSLMDELFLKTPNIFL